MPGRSGRMGDAAGRYKFTGKERDVETGLDYFGARYYDSRIGRWMAVDPLAEKYPGWSTYNYCANNPIVLIDPNGKWIVKSGDPKFGYGNIVATRVSSTERAAYGLIPFVGSVAMPALNPDPSYQASLQGAASDMLFMIGGAAIKTVSIAAKKAGELGMSLLINQGGKLAANALQTAINISEESNTTFMEATLFNSMEQMGLGVEHFGGGEMTFYFKNDLIEKQGLTNISTRFKMKNVERLIKKMIRSMGEKAFEKYIKENEKEYKQQLEYEWNRNVDNGEDNE